MGSLEPRLINQAPKTWKMTFSTGTEEFKEFMSKINQIHPTIKFTHEISDTELTFLDVTHHKGERFKSTILDVKTPTTMFTPHPTPPTQPLKAITKGETKRYQF